MGYRRLPSLEEAEVGVPAVEVAVVPAPEEEEEVVVEEARAAEPASEVVTAAALLSAEATEAVPPLVAEKAWAGPLQQEGEVSSSMVVRYRYRHQHHRRRNPTERERRQV
jgi:hypothetical protein